MREETLRDFFLHKVTAAQLADDIRAAHQIKDMDEAFAVTRPMLISLCDSILKGEIPPELLQPIGFALVTSDKFEWEDDVIAGVVHDWAAPEINFPLTMEATADFRGWLLGIGPYPAHWGQC